MLLMLAVVACYTICSLSDKYAVSKLKMNGSTLTFIMAAATVLHTRIPAVRQPVFRREPHGVPRDTSDGGVEISGIPACGGGAEGNVRVRAESVAGADRVPFLRN